MCATPFVPYEFGLIFESPIVTRTPWPKILKYVLYVHMRGYTYGIYMSLNLNAKAMLVDADRTAQHTRMTSDSRGTGAADGPSERGIFF